MKFNRKFLLTFFILSFFITACTQEVTSTSSDKPEKQSKPSNEYTYTIIDSEGNTIFPETPYTSDIDLTDATLKLTLLSQQIGWEDQDGNIYPLNTIIKDCSGNKIFKPCCYKNTPDSPGDIRLSNGKFVTADQIDALNTQLVEPVSVVLTFTLNNTPCNLEMALDFKKCKFWTEDSAAYEVYREENYFTGNDFPQGLYNLCSTTWETDGRVIYQKWCEEISDGDTDKYPAFYFAENCTKGGFTDWYLPSKDEIDGKEMVQNAPAISKALIACGYDYLFEGNDKIYYSYNPEIKFPVFWFFRIGYGKALKDVWNSDGICHNPEYACAVRRF